MDYNQLIDYVKRYLNITTGNGKRYYVRNGNPVYYGNGCHFMGRDGKTELIFWAEPTPLSISRYNVLIDYFIENERLVFGAGQVQGHECIECINGKWNIRTIIPFPSCSENLLYDQSLVHTINGITPHHCIELNKDLGSFLRIYQPMNKCMFFIKELCQNPDLVKFVMMFGGFIIDQQHYNFDFVGFYKKCKKTKLSIPELQRKLIPEDNRLFFTMVRNVYGADCVFDFFTAMNEFIKKYSLSEEQVQELSKTIGARKAGVTVRATFGAKAKNIKLLEILNKLVESKIDFVKVFREYKENWGCFINIDSLFEYIAVHILLNKPLVKIPIKDSEYKSEINRLYKEQKPNLKNFISKSIEKHLANQQDLSLETKGIRFVIPRTMDELSRIFENPLVNDRLISTIMKRLERKAVLLAAYGSNNELIGLVICGGYSSALYQKSLSPYSSNRDIFNMALAEWQEAYNILGTIHHLH